ncbi:MAG: hypothetical protein EOM34_03305 [Clostridia bacterium]|nr:hypothetical protein [Clostridia bacterium]NCD01736.1 hypothetical protein [Clostridia bacterium]
MKGQNAEDVDRLKVIFLGVQLRAVPLSSRIRWSAAWNTKHEIDMLMSRQLSAHFLFCGHTA